MFSNLKIGQKINNRILNKSLKDLYFTNYFKMYLSPQKMVLLKSR